MMTEKNNGAAKKQEFIIRSHKQLHIGIIGVMCVLIVLCIKLSVDYEIIRDVFAAVNTLIDIVLMIFLAMLFGFSASNKYMQSRQNIVFSLLIIVVFAMLFCSTLSTVSYR